MNFLRKVFYWAADSITSRVAPGFSPDMSNLVQLTQGDLAYYLGNLNVGRRKEIHVARDAAVQSQILLVAADTLFQNEIPQEGAPRGALFDLLGSRTPEQLRTALNERFPGQITDSLLSDVGQKVNLKKGLEQSHPAVPGFGQIFNKYVDRKFSDSILALSQGMRIVVKLQTAFPTPRIIREKDSPLVLRGSDALVALSASQLSPADRAKYLNDGMYCIKESLQTLHDMGYGVAAFRVQKAINRYLNKISDEPTRNEFRAAFRSPQFALA
jgi:hypothetical protein